MNGTSPPRLTLASLVRANCRPRRGGGGPIAALGRLSGPPQGAHYPFKGNVGEQLGLGDACQFVFSRSDPLPVSWNPRKVTSWPPNTSLLAGIILILCRTTTWSGSWRCLGWSASVGRTVDKHAVDILHDFLHEPLDGASLRILFRRGIARSRWGTPSESEPCLSWRCPSAG